MAGQSNKQHKALSTTRERGQSTTLRHSIRRPKANALSVSLPRVGSSNSYCLAPGIVCCQGSYQQKQYFAQYGPLSFDTQTLTCYCLPSGWQICHATPKWGNASPHFHSYTSIPGFIWSFTAGKAAIVTSTERHTSSPFPHEL